MVKWHRATGHVNSICMYENYQAMKKGRATDPLFPRPSKGIKCQPQCEP